MKCASAIDRMLEADPQELAGSGDGELASHIATCEPCSAMAAQIVNSQLELAQELDSHTPRLRADEALRITEGRAASKRRRNNIWQIGAPMAAAAGFAGVVLLGGGHQDIGSTALARVQEPLPGLEVQGPPGKDVAVFEVADRPDVVVVWFFDAGDD